MPIPIDPNLPLGPQLGYPDTDLGTNARPISLEQLSNRTRIAEKLATAPAPTPDARAWLADVAPILLPPEWHDSIAGFPVLAGQAAMMAIALPLEQQARWVSGLLQPHTLAEAAAKGGVEAIRSMAFAISTGSAADAALQDQMARQLMTPDVFSRIAEQADHISIGHLVACVRRLHNPAHLVQVLAPLLTDRAIHTLQEGVINARPQGALAMGFVAEALHCMSGNQGSPLADALLTPEVCAAVAATGNAPPLALMAMGAMAMSADEGFPQAMEHLAGESACTTLKASADAMVMGHMLHAAVNLDRAGHPQGQAVIQRLLDGPAVPEAMRKLRRPEPALHAMEAACCLPEGPARQAALAPLFSHEVMGTTISDHPQRLGAMTAFAMQLDAGPARDEALGQLVKQDTCRWVRENGDPVDKATFLEAAALLPDASARQTMQAVLNGNPTPWQAALAQARPPTPRPPGPAGGASL